MSEESEADRFERMCVILEQVSQSWLLLCVCMHIVCVCSYTHVHTHTNAKNKINQSTSIEVGVRPRASLIKVKIPLHSSAARPQSSKPRRSIEQHQEGLIDCCVDVLRFDPTQLNRSVRKAIDPSRARCRARSNGKTVWIRWSVASLGSSGASSSKEGRKPGRAHPSSCAQAAPSAFHSP